MNPSRPFILRPVATSLVMLAIVIAGILGYRMLPVSSLPDVEFPTIQVQTLYPGAGPAVMQSNVTAPLENELGEISGLQDMKSNSTSGSSVITLRFSLSTDIGVAQQDVQAAINQAQSLLPSDLPMEPSYKLVNPADAPILSLAIDSDEIPLSQVRDLIDTRIAQRISQVQGVGMVSLAGGNKPALRVDINPRKAAAYGLSLDQIRSSVSDANVNLAKGSIYGRYRTLSIDANDQLMSADDYRRIIIKYKDGAAVRLSDVADVTQGPEDRYQAAYANNKQALILNVNRQPGANVINTVNTINNMLPTLQRSLPPSVHIQELSDRTQTIRASISDVKFELVLSIALVVMVTFLFLRNIRATLIPSIAIPLTLVGTFALMYMLSFSMDNLSLMALTIATGFVIDDAIVVLENIMRHLEKGKPPLKAALEGSHEIVFTVISLTISLVAVLIPLLFMQDVTGRLFREFALTLTCAILLSAFVSLTLTPMLCGLLLKRSPEQQQREKEEGEEETVTAQDAAGSSDSEDFHAHSKGFLGWLERGYERTLRKALGHQPIMLIVAIGAFAVTGLLYLSISKGLLPTADTGQIQGIVDASQDTSFEALAKRQHLVAEAIESDPAVKNVSSIIGVDGTNSTPNSGRLTINLKNIGERDDVQTVIERLNKRTTRIAGVHVYLQPVQELVLEDQIGRAPYQMSLTNPDRDRLNLDVESLLKQLRASPAISVAATASQNNGSQLYLDVNRDTASRLGISMSDIDSTLYSAFGQRLVSTIFSQSTQYRVVFGIKNSPNDDLDTLNHLYLASNATSSSEGSNGGSNNSRSSSSSTSNSTMVPLSSLVTIKERRTPLSLPRDNQLASSQISFDVARGYALSDAFSAIDKARQQGHLSSTTQLDYQGAAAVFANSNSSTLWLILAAIVAAYIVLGVLYESYIHPITVLSTLPSAGIGALLALKLGGMDLGMVGIIGIILLIGIVKKNAIMMIDFALEAQRHQALAPHEAIFRAANLRFRPIMMTTFAALLGALPLMFAHGYGAELRKPLGYAMVGGLLVSQLLTLYTTPVVYLYFERLSQWWQRRRQPEHRDEEAS